MNNGHPDTHGHYPGDPDEKYCKLCNPMVQNIIEPEDGLLSDMVNELDLTDDFKVNKEDTY